MVIAFDADGTLFDTKKEIIASVNKVLKAKSIPEIQAEEEDLFIGPSFGYSLPLYRSVSEEQAEEIIYEFREIYKDVILESLPYRGAEQVLWKLQQDGVHLVLATNKQIDQAEALLGKYKLKSFFEALYTRGTLKEKKSQMLHQIREKYAADDTFIMVGDTEGDLEAAVSEGFEFFEASYGYGAFKDENKYQLQDISDIFRILESLGNSMYISLDDFARNASVSVRQVKHRYKEIPGISKIGKNYVVLSGTRYPCDLHRYKMEDSARRRFLLLKTISQYKYITHMDLKIEQRQFEEMIRDFLSAGLIKPNHLPNEYGANAYDCTPQGDHLLKMSEKEAINEMVSIIAGAAGTFAGAVLSKVYSD